MQITTLPPTQTHRVTGEGTLLDQKHGGGSGVGVAGAGSRVDAEVTQKALGCHLGLDLSSHGGPRTHMDMCHMCEKNAHVIDRQADRCSTS